MSDSFKCSFCKNYFVLTHESFSEYKMSFDHSDRNFNKANRDGSPYLPSSEIIIGFYKCPKCNNISVSLIGAGNQFKDRKMTFNPVSGAIQLPTYIPEQIRKDYEEASLIVNLSPKASATISRRCIQGMIRDFWKINKRTLNDEITAIEEKVDPSVKQVLHSLRQIGNIGAHPEKDINIIVDVEAGEALKLIKFIEYLVEEWYIKRQNTSHLLEDIKSINESKQNKRKGV